MELCNACQTQQRKLVVEVNVQGSESGMQIELHAPRLV